MIPELCLGTAQFGLPYGVTNLNGQVPESEVRSILTLAAQAGITRLDTAQAYGTAEEVVGRCIRSSSNYRLISKLSAHTSQETWEVDFQASLKRLSVDRLDGFLLHSSSDLRGSSGEKLLNWLEGLRGRGLVDRIGISIYESKELEGLPLDRLQMIQLPLSIYDQRLLNDGTVDFLYSLGKFLSVKKTKEVSWNELKPMVISHLNDYFEKNNEPILKNKKNTPNNVENNDETVNKIIEVLDTKIRPAVARDGGDIKFKSFEDGVVKVELQGSCSGCPSSLMTLKQGVQNLLKHYVKEVNSVVAI